MGFNWNSVGLILNLFVFFLIQDWDKPEHIPDPEATKPEDWDDDTDGEWEPPMISNPEYKVGVVSHCHGNSAR